MAPREARDAALTPLEEQWKPCSGASLPSGRLSTQWKHERANRLGIDLFSCLHQAVISLHAKPGRGRAPKSQLKPDRHLCREFYFLRKQSIDERLRHPRSLRQLGRTDLVWFDIG